MKGNIILVCAGIILLFSGIIRMGLIKFDQRFLINILPLIIVAIILLGFIYHTGGPEKVSAALKKAGYMSADFMPMLICMFVTMGAAIVLIDGYRAQLLPYMAGKNGLLGALGAAVVMPGSLTSVPIVKELWYSTPEARISLLLFMSTSTLIGWQIFLIRQPMMGWGLSLIVLASNLCSAFVMYLCFRVVLWVLPLIKVWVLPLLNAS